MNISENLFDFKWYSENLMSIQTKVDGLQPFKLRKIQNRYVDHLNKDFPNGIIRSIVLKPRQSGFSTLVAGINCHKMWTRKDEKGIMLADKLARTKEVFSIYDTFRKSMSPYLLPTAHKKDILNSEEWYFESMRCGFKSETSNDPNAGRSGTRRWAHLTEFAFYSNADSIDEGVQNSIPLAHGTRVFKESTAYGISGVGKSFYNQWEAANRGDSIYKPFFVSWFEVEDYAITPFGKFELTKLEKDLIKMCPEVTIPNLAWRRLKLSEYASSTDQIFTPEERFAQDFPSYPDEAFLSSGRPVFDQDKLRKHIHHLTINTPAKIKVNITKPFLTMYQQFLTVFKTPEKNERYIIGADTAEGLEHGDYCSAFIMNKACEQVAMFHGKIDPDHFGKLLVELAKIYNEALLVPEINNTGYATLSAIKNESYFKVYMRSVFDEIGIEQSDKMGFRTTAQTKQLMLSKLIALYRDDGIRIVDVNLLKEMQNLTRESNGNVTLNSQDRVVACCLACMGLDQSYEPAIIVNPNVKEKLQFETRDLYKEKKYGKEKLV